MTAKIANPELAHEVGKQIIAKGVLEVARMFLDTDVQGNGLNDINRITATVAKCLVPEADEDTRDEVDRALFDGFLDLYSTQPTMEPWSNLVGLHEQIKALQQQERMEWKRIEELTNSASAEGDDRR